MRQGHTTDNVISTVFPAVDSVANRIFASVARLDGVIETNRFNRLSIVEPVFDFVGSPSGGGNSHTNRSELCRSQTLTCGFAYRRLIPPLSLGNAGMLGDRTKCQVGMLECAR